MDKQLHDMKDYKIGDMVRVTKYGKRIRIIAIKGQHILLGQNQTCVNKKGIRHMILDLSKNIRSNIMFAEIDIDNCELLLTSPVQIKDPVPLTIYDSCDHYFARNPDGTLSPCEFCGVNKDK